MANTNAYAVPLFVVGYCGSNVLERQNEQEVQSPIGRISMERHPNQNAFTWKRMKPTVCITAQYNSVIMLDFKVKEGAENMLIPSTAGSSILTKSQIRKKSILQWRTQFKIKRAKPQSMLLRYFRRFHHRVISVKYLQNG